MYDSGGMPQDSTELVREDTSLRAYEKHLAEICAL